MPKIATSAIILKDNKVLIGKRKKDGLWEFPGGKIDPGETPEECILREINEEVGITVHIESALEMIKGIYRDIPMEVYPFVVSWVEGEVKDFVHSETKWVGPKELQEYDFVDEDKLMFSALEGLE